MQNTHAKSFHCNCNFLHLTYLLETPVELYLNLVWIYMLQVHQLLLEEDYSLMSQGYLQEEYDHSSQQTPAVEDYSLKSQGYLQEEYDHSFQQTLAVEDYSLMSQGYLQEEHDHSFQQTPAVEDYSLMVQGYLQEEHDHSFQQTPALGSYNQHANKGQLIDVSRKRKRKNGFYNRRIVWSYLFLLIQIIMLQLFEEM